MASAVLVLTAACSDGKAFSSAAERRAQAATDTAYAAIQSRGAHAMGVDQYTATHRFTPTPDGGRIELRRDQIDSTGARQIQLHMEQIAAAFKAGDFALPGFVHARDVPGTATMAERRALIGYTVEPVPGGAALRLQSSDPDAVQAIHEFLTFQRADHHSR
jgi:hypothetical protein